MVRGAQPGVPGPAPGRLGARDFFEAAEGEAGGARRGGEAEDPGREGCCDARQSCLNLLPYVGPGWYPKVSLAAMLELGVCRWDHIVLGISARSHVDAATLRRALERMDAAWQGEEHMAKLSVNAMIGLWARSTEVVYSVRSSELDGAGADLGLCLRGGHGVGLRLRAEAAEQRHLPPHPRRGARQFFLISVRLTHVWSACAHSRRSCKGRLNWCSAKRALWRAWQSLLRGQAAQRGALS